MPGPRKLQAPPLHPLAHPLQPGRYVQTSLCLQASIVFHDVWPWQAPAPADVGVMSALAEHEHEEDEDGHAAKQPVDDDGAGARASASPHDDEDDDIRKQIARARLQVTDCASVLSHRSAFC